MYELICIKIQITKIKFEMIEPGSWSYDMDDANTNNIFFITRNDFYYVLFMI